MKKVCMLTTVHPATDTRIFIKEAQSLKAAGYDLTLIAPNEQEEVKEGIKIIPLNTPRNRFERIFKNSFYLYKKALKIKADIYHLHDPELIPIGLLLEYKGKKVIYDVHEDVPQQILSKDWIWKPIRNLVSKAAKISEKIADRNFDAIVSATPKINEKFINPHSITVQNFPLLSELKLINNKSGNDNYKYITYVGGITSERGIKEMVKAVGLISDRYKLKLLLAGKFNSKKLKEETQKINGWEKVEFLGWINREEISQIFSKSVAGLVVLQPLDRYKVSYPVKMFEYMSASLPVIASNFCLWEKILGENNCGINVDPISPKKIARGIKYILDNPKEAKIMGENGEKAVREKYNWSVEKKKLINLYEKLLSD